MSGQFLPFTEVDEMMGEQEEEKKILKDELKNTSKENSNLKKKISEIGKGNDDGKYKVLYDNLLREVQEKEKKKDKEAEIRKAKLTEQRKKSRDELEIFLKEMKRIRDNF